MRDNGDYNNIIVKSVLVDCDSNPVNCVTGVTFNVIDAPFEIFYIDCENNQQSVMYTTTGFKTIVDCLQVNTLSSPNEEDYDNITYPTETCLPATPTPTPSPTPTATPTPTPSPTPTPTVTPTATPVCDFDVDLTIITSTPIPTTPTPTPISPTPTPVPLTTYTGCARGNTFGGVCADAENNRTFYSNCGPFDFTTGCFVYVNTSPNALTGYEYVFINGSTWDINNSTGQITGLSSDQC